MVKKDNLIQEYVSISILEVKMKLAMAVSSMLKICKLYTVEIHIMMMKTLYQAICVVIVVEVILIQMYLACCVQIQTMGPRTIMATTVKIILMVMHKVGGLIMANVIQIMMMKTFYQEKCVVYAVAANTSAEI